MATQTKSFFTYCAFGLVFCFGCGTIPIPETNANLDQIEALNKCISQKLEDPNWDGENLEQIVIECALEYRKDPRIKLDWRSRQSLEDPAWDEDLYLEDPAWDESAK